MKPTIEHIPVFIDSVSIPKDVGQTRLSYFNIECEEPHPIVLSDDGFDLPILLMELEGIIVTGLDGKSEFTSQKIISELFDYVNDESPYVISTSYIFLPNEQIERFIDRKLKLGDVLRVCLPWFIQGRNLERTPSEIPLFDSTNKETKKPIWYSGKESEAFRKWTEHTIMKVKDRYKENPKNNLRERAKRGWKE